MTFNTIDLINPIKLGVDKTRPTVKVGQYMGKMLEGGKFGL